MKKTIAINISICFLAAPSLYADVVMEMVTTNSSGQESDRSKIYAKDSRLRMDSQGIGSQTSMIFLGTEALILNHDEQSYFVMDEAMLNQVSNQISDAMKLMEEQLAGLPPEKRAMVEQMMKGQKGDVMGEQPSKSAPQVMAAGHGNWKTHDCTHYEVFENGQKTQLICAADMDDIDGSEQMMEAFSSLARFISKLTESHPMAGQSGINPGEIMDQIDGFPVHTVNFENGQMNSETSLDSVSEEDVDEAMFIPPPNYQRQNTFVGM